MNIVGKLTKFKTKSGKPEIDFSCTDCGIILLDFSGWFYNSNLKKKNLEHELNVFIQAINSKNVHFLFKNRKTADKMLKRLLDSCICGDEEALTQVRLGVDRAKQILAAANKYLLLVSAACPNKA